MATDPPVIYDFDPRNLPPDFLRAIGLATAAAAQTESVVQHFIGALLGIDEIETIALTAHMAAPLKDHIARALIELNAIDADIVDQVDDLLDAIGEAAAKRNVLVHNSFARHPETGEVFSVRERARGSLQVSLQSINVEQIEEDATSIYEVGMNLMRFMMAHDLHPLPRIRPIRTPLDRREKARKARKDGKVRDPK